MAKDKAAEQQTVAETEPFAARTPPGADEDFDPEKANEEAEQASVDAARENAGLSDDEVFAQAQTPAGYEPVKDKSKS